MAFSAVDLRSDAGVVLVRHVLTDARAVWKFPVAEQTTVWRIHESSAKEREQSWHVGAELLVWDDERVRLAHVGQILLHGFEFVFIEQAVLRRPLVLRRQCTVKANVEDRRKSDGTQVRGMEQHIRKSSQLERA